MDFPADVARFLEGPVLITLATRDAMNRPMIARGSGGRLVRPAHGCPTLEVAISGHLWPETVENLRENGRLATTFVDPATYRAFQLKGLAQFRPTTPADVARAEAYVERTLDLLGGLGIAAAAIHHWLSARDVAIAALAVERIFEQTPGPRSGTVVA